MRLRNTLQPLCWDMFPILLNKEIFDIKRASYSEREKAEYPRFYYKRK